MSDAVNIPSVCSLEKLDIIFTVVSRGKGENVVEIMKKSGIFQNTVSQGRGTAPSSVLDLLGLGATEKDVVYSIVKHERCSEVLDTLEKKLEFSKPGHGISFSVPIQSVAGMMAFKYITADLSEEV